MEDGIVLIGTGHVLDLRTVLLKLLSALDPNAVAVELDPQRLHALRERERGIEVRRPPGIQSWLANYQEKIAADHGVKSGEDMLTGVEGAQLLSRPLFLVDRPIQETMRLLKKEWPLRERIRIGADSVWEFVKGSVKKQGVDSQLEDYNRDPDKYLGDFQQKYPHLHRIMLSSRDEFMATRLKSLRETHGKVVAILGDAHVGGIESALKQLGINPVLYRLSDLQNGTVPQAELPMRINFGSSIPEDSQQLP